MNAGQLTELIKKKKSFLCVGLDTDIQRIPQFLHNGNDPVFEFNKRIIDATLPYAAAYKPNLAFYESLGAKGWESLRKTTEYLRTKEKEIFIIADAKRGDIGNTSAMYARTFFEVFDFDAVTLSPYMGFDTVEPFLQYEDKWVIILGLTSNKSASDFEELPLQNGQRLYEKVLETASQWGTRNQIMFVAGATQAKAFGQIRKIVPGHFLLVPGIGAQGGSLGEVAAQGMNSNCGLLVNSSRGIIYASGGKDFAEKAAEQALSIQQKMKRLLREKGIL